jgi:hypothetical protein
MAQHTQYAPLNPTMADSARPSPTAPSFFKPPLQTDPFSNQFSSGLPELDTPISVAISMTSTEAGSPDAADPSPFKATVTCCRCDNRQRLFPDWKTNGSANSATCEKCTSAFCRKCTLSSETLVQFDAKGRALIPAEVFDVSFHWLCRNCGSLYDVPVSQVRRKNGVATVEIKTLFCEPCNQRATGETLLIALRSKDSSNQPASSVMDQSGVVAPPMQNRYSDSFFTRKLANPEAEPRRRWSLKSLKRWTSISSTSFKPLG